MSDALDPRESIIRRIVWVCERIHSINAVYRNMAMPDDGVFPAAVVLDGSETRGQLEMNLGRFAIAPAIMDMQPEIVIALGDVPEDVGTRLNALRIDVVRAIMQDDGLRTLTGNQPNRIRFEGCATGLAAGRAIVGAMTLTFTFSYLLYADQL